LHDFQCFYDWAIQNKWVEGLEIDRKHNDVGYSPDNCRIVTRKINLANKGIYTSNTSGYVGVSPRKDGRYIAVVSVKGKPHYLGLFVNPIDAVTARNKYIVAHRLPFKIQQPIFLL
jgi:hypothetical protein